MNEHIRNITISFVIAILLTISTYIFCHITVYSRILTNFEESCYSGTVNIIDALKKEVETQKKFLANEISQQEDYESDISYYDVAFDNTGKITKIYPPYDYLLGKFISLYLFEKAKTTKDYFFIGFLPKTYAANSLKLVMPDYNGETLVGGHLYYINGYQLFNILQRENYSAGNLFIIDQNGYFLTSEVPQKYSYFGVAKAGAFDGIVLDDNLLNYIKNRDKTESDFAYVKSHDNLFYMYACDIVFNESKITVIGLFNLHTVYLTIMNICYFIFGITLILVYITTLYLHSRREKCFKKALEQTVLFTNIKKEQEVPNGTK